MGPVFLRIQGMVFSRLGVQFFYKCVYSKYLIFGFIFASIKKVNSPQRDHIPYQIVGVKKVGKKFSHLPKFSHFLPTFFYR